MHVVLCAVLLWSAAASSGAPAATEPNRFARMSDDEILRIADVPRHHWAADAVIRLYRLGVLQGYPETPKAKRK